VGSATTGHIVTPKLVLVALRQIRENRLGQDSVVLPLVWAARGASACCLGSVPAAESASEVRALFLGWTRRLVPKPDQKPKATNA